MQYRKLSELKKLEGNPRVIRDKQFKALCNSIRDNPEYFEARPLILSNRTGEMVIIAGNMRYEAARSLKLADVPTFLMEGLTEEKEREIIIRDNISNGDWNFDTLANEWSDMPLAEWGVELPEDWLSSPEDLKDAEPQIDKAEELNKLWQVKAGDLWLIGGHRLLCGNSTKTEDVARVMGGEKADMVFTDPPYGMNLDTDFSSDDIDYDPSHIFRDFPQCKEIFLWGADYYAEKIPNRNDGCWIVWDKTEGGISPNSAYDKMYGSNFELCWSKIKHKRAIARVLWKGIFGLSKEDTKSRIHPTQKPTELCKWFIEKFSESNQSIIDLFLGSGSTLIACQKLNRKCRGIEISPAYCAVILQRMTDAFPGINIRRAD